MNNIFSSIDSMSEISLLNQSLELKMILNTSIFVIYLLNILVSCPPVETPENGGVIVTSNGSVTIATYSCSKDYTLYGDAVRACISGSWEDAAPTCGKFLYSVLGSLI
jgi:hypothetical protein